MDVHSAIPPLNVPGVPRRYRRFATVAIVCTTVLMVVGLMSWASKHGHTAKLSDMDKKLKALEAENAKLKRAQSGASYASRFSGWSLFGDGAHEAAGDFFAAPDGCGDSEITVVTYNVLNFDSNWSEDWVIRKHFIAKAVLDQKTDILAIQESRVRKDGNKEKSMANELSELLLGYDTVHSVAHTFKPGHTDGLTVFFKRSRLTMVNGSVIELGRAEQGKDKKGRIVQRLKMELLGNDKICQFELFHTHLSSDPEVKVQSIKAIIRDFLVEKPEPKIVMQLFVGDLNTPNTSTVLRTEGEDILTGKRPLSSSERRHAEFLPFTDLWTAVHGASDKGYTLSTKVPNVRTDYIMGRGSVVPRSIKKFGYPVPDPTDTHPPLYLSDHFAVVAKVAFRKGVKEL